MGFLDNGGSWENGAVISHAFITADGSVPTLPTGLIKIPPGRRVGRIVRCVTRRVAWTSARAALGKDARPRASRVGEKEHYARLLTALAVTPSVGRPVLI